MSIEDICLFFFFKGLLPSIVVCYTILLFHIHNSWCYNFIANSPRGCESPGQGPSQVHLDNESILLQLVKKLQNSNGKVLFVFSFFREGLNLTKKNSLLPHWVTG